MTAPRSNNLLLTSIVTERFKVFSEKVVASQQEGANMDPGILTTFVLDTEEWLANFVSMDSLQLLAECLQSGASFVTGKTRKTMFLHQIQSSLLKNWRLVVDSIKVARQPVMGRLFYDQFMKQSI